MKNTLTYRRNLITSVSMSTKIRGPLLYEQLVSKSLISPKFQIRKSFTNICRENIQLASITVLTRQAFAEHLSTIHFVYSG